MSAEVSPDELGHLVAVAPRGGCWLWTQSIATNGYGRVVRSGRHQQAHRWVYEQMVGPIPDGMQIDHLCRNKACVNPAHLEPVTQQENIRRHYALVTHCRHGHEYTLENTYLRPSKGGRRECKTCIRERSLGRTRGVA